MGLTFPKPSGWRMSRAASTPYIPHRGGWREVALRPPGGIPRYLGIPSEGLSQCWNTYWKGSLCSMWCICCWCHLTHMCAHTHMFYTHTHTMTHTYTCAPHCVYTHMYTTLCTLKCIKYSALQGVTQNREAWLGRPLLKLLFLTLCICILCLYHFVFVFSGPAIEPVS